MTDYESTSDSDSICTNESDDSCMQMIQFESIRCTDSLLEEAIVLSWPKTLKHENPSNTVEKHEESIRTSLSLSGTEPNPIHIAEHKNDHEEAERYKVLKISTLLEPESLAPLFSGAEWAGTRVWHAAIRAIQYLHTHHSDHLKAGSSLLELGCGLGVPGMIACQIGAKVIVTDQPNILSQLRKNLKENFPVEYDEQIQAKPLSWSRKAIQDLHHELNQSQWLKNKDTSITSERRDENVSNVVKFDFVLNCDCVYEPLYGDSWKLLIEVIDELLSINPQAIVLTSVERRQFDGIDVFLHNLNHSEHVSETNLVYVDGKNNIELYVTAGK